VGASYEDNFMREVDEITNKETEKAPYEVR
jgi:hypothetical protein